MIHNALAVLAVTWAAASMQPQVQPRTNPPEAEELVRAALIAEHATLVPGRTQWVGVTFDIKPEWHLYSLSQNDSGMPIKVAWTLPEGFKVGPLTWPAPKRHISEGDILDHIYEKRVTLLAPITVPATAKQGEKATLSADVQWLVCKGVCLPGEAKVSLTMPIDEPLAKEVRLPLVRANEERFREARQRIAIKPPPTAPITTEWSGDTLTIKAEGAKGLTFYPRPECVRVPDLLKQGESKTDRLELRIQREQAAGDRSARPAKDSSEKEPAAKVLGILEVASWPLEGHRIFLIDVPVPAPSRESPQDRRPAQAPPGGDRGG